MTPGKAIETNNFSVIKEKIIKTDELLLLFKEKSDKLGKASQAFKSLKNKYESANNEISGLKMENDRLNFTLQTINPEYQNQKIELNQLKSDYDTLNEKYQQTMIESQLTIGNLEKSLANCICQKSLGSPTKNNNSSIKIKELKKLCSDLKSQEKELRIENTNLLSKNEELELSNKQITKHLNNLRLQNASLQTENESFKEKINKIELLALQHKCNDKDEIIVQKYRNEIERLKIDLSKLSEIVKTHETEKHSSKHMKEACIQTVEIFEGIVDTKETVCNTSKHVSIQVNLMQEENDMDSLILLNNIFEEMIVPRKLSPLTLYSFESESSDLANECHPGTVDGIESDIDKNIPNIVITPPTPLVEKTDKLENELLESMVNLNSPLEDTQLNAKSDCTDHYNKSESGAATNNIEVLKVSPEISKSVNDVPLISDCKSAGIKNVLEKRKIRRIRKILMPYNPQAFVKTKCKKTKPKSIKNGSIVKRDDDSKDIILEALRTLQKNNIAFTISNESLPNLINKNDCLSQISSYPESNNIYQEKLNCWRSRCSKLESYMLLRKSEENEPELLGFSNNINNICEKNKFIQHTYSQPQHLMEQLIMSIEKLIQNQEKRGYDHSRRKRSRIKVQPSSFSSETDIELQRLFSRSPVSILDRNKRLLAAAKGRHLGSAESIFESESDVMVDSGVVTVSSKLDTDNSSSCSIHSFGVDPWKKPTYDGSYYTNTPTPKPFGRNCPNMLSPIASSKESSEKSYNFVTPDISPTLISYPELISPLNSPIKNKTAIQTNTADLRLSRRASPNIFSDNLVSLNSPVSEEEEDRKQHVASSPEMLQPSNNNISGYKLKTTGNFPLQRHKPLNVSNELLPVGDNDDKLELIKSDDNLSFNLSVKTTDLNYSLSDLNVSQLMFNTLSPSHEQQISKEETASKLNVSNTRYYTWSQKQENKIDVSNICDEEIPNGNINKGINPNDKEITKIGTSMLLRSAERKRKLDSDRINSCHEKADQLNNEKIRKKKRVRPINLLHKFKKICAKNSTKGTPRAQTSKNNSAISSQPSSNELASIIQTDVGHSKINEGGLKRNSDEHTEKIASKHESRPQINFNEQELGEVDLFGEVLSDFDDESTDISENSVCVKRRSKSKLKQSTLKRVELSSSQTNNGSDIGFSNDNSNTKTDEGKIQILQDILMQHYEVLKNTINHNNNNAVNIQLRSESGDNNHKNMSISKLSPGNNSTDIRQSKNTNSLKENSSAKSDYTSTIEKKKIRFNSNHETPVDILSQVLDSMGKSEPKQVSSRLCCAGAQFNETMRSATPVLEKRETVISNVTTTELPSEDNIPDYPQSPDVVEVPDAQPKLIPTNKPVKLDPNKVKILIEKLIVYSNEERILDNIVNEFAFQSNNYIVEIVLEKLSLDYHDKPDNSTPPSPNLTSTQRILLGFLSKLDKSTHPNIFVDFLKAAEEKLFNKNTCDLLMLQPITRFYTAICKLRWDINRMRRFICEIFYFAADFAPTMLFIILTMWAEVIPMASDISDNITAKVIVQLCHVKGCNKPGYNLLPLKDLLHKYFGYPTERWNCDEIFQDILVEFIRHPSKRLFKLTMLVFLKNKPTNWVHQKINDILIPLYQKIPASNVNLKATVLILIANICSGFDRCNEQDWAVILELDKWFQSIEREDLDSILQQSITYVRGILPRKPKKASRKKRNVKEQKNNNEESNGNTTPNKSSA
ncbi:uncharacterized protein LOC143198967 isoform X1 [Rhynchophorus ferrugineus]|uniref:uncharacterized protein LOC143198967 isoform X1 n=1 Tax=Rhynchophorus ferrugineus TaxID=354439 RepID=UPI003FCDCF30